MKRAWLLALVACSHTEAHKRPPLDDYGVVPAFALQDQTDHALTEDWMRGHVTIVDFVFTRCDTICPVLTMKMSHLDEQTEDLADVRLLSFSVDPKYDTPAVLAAYADHYGAKADRWRFVTGKYDTVQHLVEGALMSAMEDEGKPLPSGAPDIRHGGHILLVDRDLHIRGVYDSEDGDRLDDLVADARTL